MRRLGIILLFCMLGTTFCFNGTAYAQGDYELPKTGITPDSPFYFVDKLAKQFSMMFTFRQEAKLHKALQYAEERLAEMNNMIAENNDRATIRAINEYGNCLAIAVRAMERTRNRGDDTSETFALALSKHIAVLDDAVDNIPEDARETLTQTRERACICQETAVREIARKDPQRAVQVKLMLMERQRNSIRVMAGEEEGARFQGDSQETALPTDQDTGQPTILDQGYNEEQPRPGLENQAQVRDNGQHTVNSRLRQNSMFGEPLGSPSVGNENPENDRQKVPAK